MLDNDALQDDVNGGSSSARPDDMPSDLSAHSAAGPKRSLTDDIIDFFDDGKNYAQAEIAFQKSRAAYVADRSKGGLSFGIGAIMFVHLALISLVVGAVIALTPLLTAWGATGAVVLILLVGAVILGMAAKNRISAIAQTFKDTDR